MKLVLTIIVLVSIVPAISFKNGLECDNLNFCETDFKPFQSKSDNYYKTTRKMAKKLKMLTKQRSIGTHNSTDELILMESQRQLCYDDTIGFILDEAVENYTVSCLWTGSYQFGQCQTVPPKYAKKTYSYISEKEWTAKLEKVRKAIGCEEVRYVHRNHFNRNVSPVIATNSEVYICNDRCVQAGIGYLPSLVMIISLAISFFINCVDDPP